MKILNSQFFILLAMLALSTGVQAQKKFTEGTVLYDIMINTSTDKPQSAEFLNGATSAVYIKGPKSRTEMVSALGTQSTIIDNVQKKITILKEYGEQKYMINLSEGDWKDANNKYEHIDFITDNSASKDILGYKCKKALGKLSDGTAFTVWFTPELIADYKDFQYANRSLPGLALEYETTLGNLKVTYTASRISFSPVSASKFDLPKSGYRIMSYSESKGIVH